MRNTLDLRPKQEPNIVVVEKVVLQKRSFFKESFRTFAGIVLVLVAMWGVSNADETSTPSTPASSTPSSNYFTTFGIVSDISTSSLSLQNSTSTFDVSGVKEIETKSYVPLVISDINIGDKLIIQGNENGDVVSVERIISFSATSSKSIIADMATSTATATSTSTVATSTDNTDNSTTTASTTDTDASTTDASSTPSVIDNIVGGVTNVIQNIVDTITGSSSTSTDDIASTTPDATSTPTTTPDVTTPDASSTDVISNVTNTISNVVQDVVNTVTGDDASSTGDASSDASSSSQ